MVSGTAKEATAHIKINKLLEAAGWRFFPEGNLPANIRQEPNVPIKTTELDGLGQDFEKTSKGFIDFLLLDAKGFPLLVLEAKAEDKSPLIGKEQTRKYAKSQNGPFIILSNGIPRGSDPPELHVSEGHCVLLGRRSGSVRD